MNNHLTECPQDEDHPMYGGPYPCECDQILEDLKDLATQQLWDIYRDEGWL